jgi:TldD protein
MSSQAENPFVMSALNLQPTVTSTKDVVALDVARNYLLQPFELDENKLSTVLGTVMGSAVDYADLYFQQSREESWALEDGIVKEGSHSIEQGVGVRALAGDKTGFAYSDEIVLPALTEASKAARAIARGTGKNTVQAWH